MVSDFIEQYDGYLRLSEEAAACAGTSVSRTVHALLEYGAEKECYWNSERFMANVADAVVTAEFKYLSQKNTIVFIFDESSCHKTYTKDALNASKMNVRPGGKQPCMKDTVWAEAHGVPKGMKKILEDRGINTSSMKAEATDADMEATEILHQA